MHLTLKLISGTYLCHCRESTCIESITTRNHKCPWSDEFTMQFDTFLVLFSMFSYGCTNTLNMRSFSLMYTQTNRSPTYVSLVPVPNVTFSGVWLACCWSSSRPIILFLFTICSYKYVSPDSSAILYPSVLNLGCCCCCVARFETVVWFIVDACCPR